ncbi:39S mitochondrial ribosomal protein L46-domain-containing protein [Mycotypha africana]|uniref:39S mitochondrial ribosomal protein L46-domain-containing protein n=1 Tax=Mycotypha africana TaxID=64632 RepID=UPI002300B42C|nr:39S mitochondrial ribosomal protein L46-domain-containing protein [Mycotypha africana]KAI8991454.1 39S mitochondrial ribosomal protein L46-domain-containing protein [Mycotypha africana]
MLRQLIQKRSLATVASPLIVKNHRIQASVILCRAPQILRDATPFEKAYFDYTEKIQRQESLTTPTDFYFKKGSVAERRWKSEEEARQQAMTKDTSLTEAVEEARSVWEKENESLANATTKITVTDRSTKADAENDIKSLDRSLQRTLYLVVRNNKNGLWQFPEGPVDGSELLHEAAERTLKDFCGKNMDTWFVGRQPIAFHKKSSDKQEDYGSKTFFMKARIFAGQVKPSDRVSDFAWLTKEELATKLSPEYYKSVVDSLGDL